jgi:hypothetical protein
MVRYCATEREKSVSDDWIFEKPPATDVTGKIHLLYWYTEEEIAEYDFRFEIKYMDCRQETAAKNQNPIF